MPNSLRVTNEHISTKCVYSHLVQVILIKRCNPRSIEAKQSGTRAILYNSMNLIFWISKVRGSRRCRIRVCRVRMLPRPEDIRSNRIAKAVLLTFTRQTSLLAVAPLAGISKMATIFFKLTHSRVKRLARISVWTCKRGMLCLELRTQFSLKLFAHISSFVMHNGLENTFSTRQVGPC